MEIKIIVKLHFTYKNPLESNRVKGVKEIEFETAKKASDFKRIIKTLYENHYKKVTTEINNSNCDNTTLLEGFRILTEKLIAPKNCLEDIRIEEKCEIFKQTVEQIN